MLPPNEVESLSLLEELKSSLSTSGWVGAPLVLLDQNGTLLTGSHRYAAAKALGWEDSDIPTIQLAEVFEECGLDFEKTSAQNQYPLAWGSDFVWMLQDSLGEEVMSHYGIQL